MQGELDLMDGPATLDELHETEQELAEYLLGDPGNSEYTALLDEVRREIEKAQTEAS
eukprot:SAG22_NODE_511_length_9594_cov_4.553449_11_plen_57_part_00